MNYKFIDNYICSIKAVSTKILNEDKKTWSFLVEFIDTTTKDIFATPSIHLYNEPEEAIQDAYGIIELYGFRILDRKQVAIQILDWNGNEYQEKQILFDGRDFYPVENETNV